MAKVQVYLPDELHARVQARKGQLNVSGMVQEELERVLAELDRRDALAEALRAYESEDGAFTDAEREAFRSAEKATAVISGQPRRKRGKTTAA